MQNYIKKWKVTACITKWTFDITKQEWGCEITLKSLQKYQLNVQQWSKNQNVGNY